jgi:protein-tyrosine kinase
MSNMNLIEEAARRLGQLGKAGIQVPERQPDRGQRDHSTDVAPVLRMPATPAIEAIALDGAGAGRREPYIAERPAATETRKLDINFGPLANEGYLTPGAPESRLLHEFRIIKRPLIENALGKSATPLANPNLIMVTSALPGEGKSFVSLNLALSMAMEVDCRVLLVDADVIAPSIPGRLGIAPAQGLMDVLMKPDVRLGDVLYRTNVERLSLCLAGTPHSGASEWLASEAMSSLLREMSSRYRDRIIIFDSPPLLATTESRVLASRMGQVVVVVEAERTAHGAVESALATIEGCPVVMTMLNKAPESMVGSYYGYYGYGH